MTNAYVTFGVNMTAFEVMILLINDDIAEFDEYFTVNLTELTPNVLIETYSVDVTIIDDDGKFINPIIMIDIICIHICTYVQTYELQ